MIQEPIKFLVDNLKTDTMLYIGAWQTALILVRGYLLPIMFFKTQREMHIFNILVKGYLAMCEEIYDVIKENEKPG